MCIHSRRVPFFCSVILQLLSAFGQATICTVECDPNGNNHTAVQTVCLQNALDSCHNKSPSHPAVVVLPAGIYHTGALLLPSRTTLRLAAGATLLGSINPSDYPLVGPLEGYGLPRDCCCNDWLKYNCSGLGIGVRPQYTLRHRALLSTAAGAEEVAIEGADPHSSVIDGQGWEWWARFETHGLYAGRPHLVEPMFVTDFRIERVWLKDSPFWTLHPYASSHVVIRGLRITADPMRGHNTDGIDPDSCSDVLVEDCYVRVGDDAVAIKSGIDQAGRKFKTPSRDMLFKNCTFASKRVAIGSEESGGISNITIEDCTLGALDDPSEGFNPGINLKSERGRGGYMQNITFRRLKFQGPVKQPIMISLFYSDARNATNRSATPRMSSITLEDMVVPTAVDSSAAGWAGALVGLPESPITDMKLSNVTVLALPRAASTAEIEHIDAPGWICSDVQITAVDVQPPLPKSCLRK